MHIPNTSDKRLFEAERKDEILHVIMDNDFPLVWEDGVDGGIVTAPAYNWETNPYDFTEFDKAVLALDPEPAPATVTLIPVHVEEIPLKTEFKDRI